MKIPAETRVRAFNMARDTAWGAEFQRRMREYDESRGVARPAVVPVGPEDPPLPGDSYGAVKAARQEWEASAKLRQEFGDCFDRFLAFKRADARGLIRIFSRGAA